MAPGGRALLVDEQFHDPAHPEFDRFGDDDHEHIFDQAELDDVVAALTNAGFVEIGGEKTTMVDLPVLRFDARTPL